MIKKLILLLTIMLFTNPCNAKEIYRDNSYHYGLDSVLITNYGRELYYTLYVTPLLNTPINDRYYKASITQNINTNNISISRIYALDINGKYIHTDTSKEAIKTVINNNKSIIKSQIMTYFTVCKEDLTDLFCIADNN